MAAQLLNTLKQLHIDLDSIADPGTRASVIVLLNAVEQLAQETQQLKEDNQALKDEINRLKGEQGQPSIRPQKKKSGDISSEQERKKRASTPPKKPRRSKADLVIHDEVTCVVDKRLLPDDAVCKGHEKVVVQDIVIQARNTAYYREVVYSPSARRRFVGELPTGIQGGFAPGVKALVLCLYHDANLSQPGIHRLLDTAGLVISKATISRMVTDDLAVFHDEKSAIVAAGLHSTNYQHLDDTSARVNGFNHYNHVLCNPFYTAYFTRPRKDRLTVLAILNQGPLQFQLNHQTLEDLVALGLPDKQQQRLQPLLCERLMGRTEMEAMLTSLFPDPDKQATNRRRILEACALTAFQQQGRPFSILMSDDAPQFEKLMAYRALCWIHEGRHYKKLRPVIPLHRESVERVITAFWDFYQALLDYRQAPSEIVAERLSNTFDDLFSQQADYALLDDRLKKTREKKDSLLLVLKYPELPLHNNSAELGARAQARKRDVSLQTKNAKGTEAKDTMMTLVQTARKWHVNVLEYIHDRVSQRFNMPSLASLISSESQAITVRT